MRWKNRDPWPTSSPGVPFVMRWKNRDPIPVADQKDRGLWERDWPDRGIQVGSWKSEVENRMWEVANRKSEVESGK